MAKAKHKHDMGKLKSQAQEDQARMSGGGKMSDKMMKYLVGTNKILILPPYKKGRLYKKVMKHQLWKGKRPIISVGSPAKDEGEKDKLMEYAWKLKDKYAAHRSKKLQELYRLFLPVNETYVNCLDLKDIEKGVRVAKLPAAAFSLLLDEINELDNLDYICDFVKQIILYRESQHVIYGFCINHLTVLSIVNAYIVVNQLIKVLIVGNNHLLPFQPFTQNTYNVVRLNPLNHKLFHRHHIKNFLAPLFCESQIRHILWLTPLIPLSLVVWIEFDSFLTFTQIPSDHYALRFELANQTANHTHYAMNTRDSPPLAVYECSDVMRSVQ